MPSADRPGPAPQPWFHARLKQRLLLGLALVLPLSLFLSHATRAAAPGGLALANPPVHLEIDYTWRGYATVFPTEHYVFEMDKTGQYRVTGKHEEEVIKGAAKGQNWQVSDRLPNTGVKALLNAIEQARWAPADKAIQQIDHTDDYPSLSLSFSTAKNQKVRLFSTSNTRFRTPWNLSVDEQIYNSSNPAIGLAVKALREQLAKLPHKPL